MKYGIALFPPRQVQDLANSYRKRYDPHYTLIPPHVTLKSPFKLGNRTLDDIINQLQDIASTTPAFQMHFHKVSTFHPTNNVVYLAVQNPEPVTELHNRCNDGVLHDEEAYHYVPHLTIGQNLSNGEILDVYGSLRLTNINVSAEIDRFHLLYQMENEMWTVYQTFLLQESGQ